MFASDFPHEIPMEDAMHEINEILERNDINDSHKSMILGDNAKTFYNIR
jgi:predicted TIM-barrel fold metal-dependent hydrolase